METQTKLQPKTYMNWHQYARIKCHQCHFYWLVSRLQEQSHYEMVNPRFLILLEFYRSLSMAINLSHSASLFPSKTWLNKCLLTHQISLQPPASFSNSTMLVIGCVPRLLELYQAYSSRLFLLNGCWLVRSHFCSLKMIQIFMFSRVQTSNLKQSKTADTATYFFYIMMVFMTHYTFIIWMYFKSC